MGNMRRDFPGKTVAELPHLIAVGFLDENTPKTFGICQKRKIVILACEEGLFVLFSLQTGDICRSPSASVGQNVRPRLGVLRFPIPFRGRGMDQVHGHVSLVEPVIIRPGLEKSCSLGTITSDDL